MTTRQLNSRWRRAAVALFGVAGACVAVQCLPYGASPVPVHAQPRAEYVDPSLCANCHADIAAAFRQTGMGPSVHRVNASDQTEGFRKHNTLYNGASDRYYTMLERDGKLYEQRSQIGFEGQQANRIEKQIDYVVGSGDHARTYLQLNAEGKLIELSVSWYSELGGYWGMTPGYDRSDQSDFRRPIV